MSLGPLLAAPGLMQFHIAAAVLSLISGVAVMATPKGTSAHVGIGRIFAAAMLTTAFTSFGITGIVPGHFSPIHILSIVTLTTLPWAIYQRRLGNIRSHAIGMSLNFVGLIGAGFFALAPGRILGKAVAPITGGWPF